MATAAAFKDVGFITAFRTFLGPTILGIGTAVGTGMGLQKIEPNLGGRVPLTNPADIGRFEKSALMAANAQKGREFEAEAKKYFELQYGAGAKTQIKIQTASGAETRGDLVGKDPQGAVHIGDAKASATAPLGALQDL